MHSRALLLALAVSALSAAPNPQEIIRKSVAATKWDWAQTSQYSYLERDVESKRHSPAAARTYRVLMIDGSPYNLVTAINDQPLSPFEKLAEQRKLHKEIAKDRANPSVSGRGASLNTSGRMSANTRCCRK